MKDQVARWLCLDLLAALPLPALAQENHLPATGQTVGLPTGRGIPSPSQGLSILLTIGRLVSRLSEV